jgi:hypothetical protein
MIERRTQTRVEINQPALLHARHSSLRCAQYSPPRGQDRLSVLYFSTGFDLSADGFVTSIRCHVVWRRETTCGVAFVRQHSEDAGAPHLPGSFTAHETDPAKRRGA